MSAARRLIHALREPQSVRGLSPTDWEAMIAVARAEQLLAALAIRSAPFAPEGKIAAILDDAHRDCARGRTLALWEAEMARRALAPLGIPVVVLKGTAYAAAGLDAGEGRYIGDLDLLVPARNLDPAQAALLAAGWEWVKADAYDDLYYRRWMHELPPLIHKERDRMADVHHTILPPTARPTPDAEALVRDATRLESGLSIFSPPDLVLHSAAHLFADGDLAGGLRNLWDIDRLLREFDCPAFREALIERAALHQLASAVRRALRLSHHLYGTPVDQGFAGRLSIVDRLFAARLLARDGWGRETRKGLRFAFYVRSHWLRMPPLMLARHLLTKLGKRRAAPPAAVEAAA